MSGKHKLDWCLLVTQSKLVVLPTSLSELYSSVGIATGCGLENPGSFPDKARFSVLHSVQTGFEAHPVSYPMGTGIDTPGVK
jgi:hypothetical protein